MSFVYDIMEYKTEFYKVLACIYEKMTSARIREVVFEIILFFIGKDVKHVALLGDPPQIQEQDLSFKSLSGTKLQGGAIIHCLVQDTDFTKTNLSKVSFYGSIIERGKFDDADVRGADFRTAGGISIFVYDAFDTRTSGILEGRRAAQWLFSRGALVENPEDLNSLMGRPWYEAAREITRTLQKRIAGTHQQGSLAKCTDIRLRPFANSFVEFLMKRGVLETVHKARTGNGWVVRVAPAHYRLVEDFSND